jgi:hypothetical protein
VFPSERLRLVICPRPHLHVGAITRQETLLVVPRRSIHLQPYQYNLSRRRQENSQLPRVPRASARPHSTLDPTYRLPHPLIPRR